MTKAEKEENDRIAAVGCIACILDGYENSPAEIHHCRNLGGKRGLAPKLPLCFYHHRGQAVGIPSIHKSKTKFRERYGSEESLLEIVAGRMAVNRSRRIGA